MPSKPNISGLEFANLKPSERPIKMKSLLSSVWKSLWSVVILAGLSACGEGTRVNARYDLFLNQADPYAPRITLVGDREINQEVKTNFREPGFKAESLRDGDITDRVEVFSNLDVNRLGEYRVNYQVIDSAGRVAVDFRNVKVEDTTPPQATLLSASSIQLERTQSFNDPGVQVSDNYDASPQVIVTGDVNLDRVGQYTRVYQVSDSSGNEVILEREIEVIDTAAPQVLITSPAAGGVFAGPFTLTGICEAHVDTGAVRVTGDLAEAKEVSCSAEGQFSVEVSLSEGNGLKSIRVSQSDIAENEGTDQRTFSRGAQISIDSPAANFATQSALSLSGTCTVASGVSSDVKAYLGGAQLGQAICQPNGTYSNLNITLMGSDGPRLIRVEQTDQAMNPISATRQFIRDNQGPNLTITSPVGGSTVGRLVTVSGDCEFEDAYGNDAQALLFSGDIQPISPVSCNSNRTYSVQVEMTSAGTNKEIRVRQRDFANNERSVLREVTVDLTGPTISFTSPAVNAFVGANFSISGTCLIGDGGPITLSGDLTETRELSCISGVFSASNLNLQGSDGPKIVRASRTDAYNNRTEIELPLIKDTTPPEIEFSEPVPNQEYALDICSSFDLQASALDNLDPRPSLEVMGVVQAYRKGTYEIVYRAQDAAANSTTVAIDVTVSREDFDFGIATFTHFDSIRSRLDKKHILCNDLILSSQSFSSMGDSGNHFTGVLTSDLDPQTGLPFRVSGLVIDSTYPEEGIFDWIGASGRVERIIFENIQVESQRVVGVVAGVNLGTIRQVAVRDSSVSLDSGNREVGGVVVGQNIGTLDQVLVEDSEVTGRKKLGGLAGSNLGIISNSAAYVTINALASGSERIGGLLGSNELTGSIRNTFAFANIQISTASQVGALIGFNSFPGSVASSYYLDTHPFAGGAVTEFGSPLSAENFLLQASFVDWDFDDIWSIEEGETPPVLQWLLTP